jgi:hypothetical protein
MNEADQQAIDWLLSSEEPGIRLQARRDLLGDKVKIDAKEVAAGPWMSQLLAGQKPGGGFGGHPYKKWDGAHWRLVSMVELGLPAGEARALAAAETVLDWLLGAGHRKNVPIINGLARRCGSQEGNALAVCVRLGMADDPRVATLAESLIGWQWPDGGWNCDREPKAHHSSFNESLPPLWGLAEYASATGSVDARAAADRAAELFLDHQLFRSHTTGEVADKHFLDMRYPAYWHYEFGNGLLQLARAGALPDKRADDAIAELRSRQQPDGKWHVKPPHYWRRSGMYRDPATWESSGPSAMLTLNALRVLRAAGA